jgi:hypothetical protein
MMPLPRFLRTNAKWRARATRKNCLAPSVPRDVFRVTSSSRNIRSKLPPKAVGRRKMPVRPSVAKTPSNPIAQKARRKFSFPAKLLMQALIPRSDRGHPTAGTEYKYCKQRDVVLLLTRFLRAQSADAVKAARRIWVRSSACLCELRRQS